MKESFYDVLSNIDVKDRIKQKNGLNYLSWMWAWHELKKRYPLSYATVHETEDGMLVWKDPNGAHVKTGKQDCSAKPDKVYCKAWTWRLYLRQ